MKHELAYSMSAPPRSAAASIVSIGMAIACGLHLCLLALLTSQSALAGLGSPSALATNFGLSGIGSVCGIRGIIGRRKKKFLGVAGLILNAAIVAFWIRAILLLANICP